MAFVNPPGANVLGTPSARRATATCPIRPNRNVVTMKKVRRGVEEESDNAVDVFGGAGLSQEQLLADALGVDSSSEPVVAKVDKKKKKKKKKGFVEESDNAVDVFAASGQTQEELLRDALGDNEEAAPVSSKKKKGKIGSIVGEENAVDVFGGNGISQEDLLKNALGDDDRQIAPQKKRNKRKGKKGVVEDDENAVDVFSGASKTPEELLADALGENDSVEQAINQKSDKKEKRTVDGNGNVAVVSAGHAMPPDELHNAAHGNGKPETAVSYLELADTDPTADASTHQGATESNPMGSNDVFGCEDLSTVSSTEEDIEEVGTLEEDEDFEPDTEVVEEFETAAMQFKEFTRGGRRESKKAKRRERNEAEGRLVNPRMPNLSVGGERYTSVRLEDVTVTFRNTTVLQGVTWGVRTGERVGLVGENGCGKTTQLRIIAGLMEPSSGEVLRSSERVKASFLRQEFVDELDPTRTLREEFYSAFSEESQLLREYNQCEREIENAGEDLEKLELLLNRLEELRGKCDEKDAWNLDARIDKVLPGLGFVEDDNDKLVAAFSGGWKVRIGLGKVLLQDPDLLLLDEPSNHLDNESVEWLEEYLQSCRLPMVVVSHDREFLDRVCTKIVDIDGGEAFEYPGNYTTFVKLKAEQRKAWEAAYERQQRFIKEQESYIKRNRRTPARASQVKSREKMLQRMERTGQLVRQPPRQGKPLVFRFPPAPRSGRDCIIVDEVTHGYNGRNLFEEASIAIERGDRIALIGPNGSGKSTLLRMITGREEPQNGTVECEELTNISLAYYEQNQADALDLDVTVLDTLRKAAPPEMRYEEIRALLGKFLFKGDDVEKMVGALSGGEKARLALAKIMLEPANVLVLDEPGNHLSISAKEMLEEALQHFDGTLLIVSHDRYLVSQVATQILAVEDRELVLYDGDYKSYMEKNAELRARLQARFIPGVAEIKSAPKIVAEEPAQLLDKKQKRKKNFGGSGINSGKTKEMNAKRWNR
eukprot:GFKZ01011465.1.p1 GENE.GFKZ01011465.1~~GFKZ01011465.1.p1  ORF type:complete len:994 (-),score=231.79 GFKZ01011465.1:481-3462(-)